VGESAAAVCVLGHLGAVWTMKSTPIITHEIVSRRAHQIWENAGRPDGSQLAHWLQAEHELNTQQAATGDADRNRGRRADGSSTSNHIPDHAPHSTDPIRPAVTTDSLHHRRGG